MDNDRDNKDTRDSFCDLGFIQGSVPSKRRNLEMTNYKENK